MESSRVLPGCRRSRSRYGRYGHHRFERCFSRVLAALPTDGSGKRSFTYIVFVRTAGAKRRHGAKPHFRTGKALPRRCRLSLVYMVLTHPKS